MQTYQSTPDFYRDYIEHGWLKDQAAKVHKYIERWRGKNGKWYYSYKSKAQEQVAKLRRNIGEDGRLISRAGDIHRTKDGIYTSEDRRNKSGYQYSNHKTSQGYTHSRADFGDIGSRVVKTTKVSSKISRKPKRNKSLKDRGFSTSQGSGESKRQSNLGTRKSVNNESNRTKQKQKAGVKGYTGNARKRGYSSSKTRPSGPSRITYVQRDYDPLSKNGYRDSTTDDGYSRKAIANLTSEKEHSRALRNYYRIAEDGPYIIKKGSNGTYTRRLRRQVRK